MLEEFFSEPRGGLSFVGDAMRWVKFSLFGMAVIAGPAFASPVQWTISEASSGVTVSHQGSSKAAVRGEKVQTGDKVITGPNDRAVLVRGEEYDYEIGRAHVCNPVTNDIRV